MILVLKVQKEILVLRVIQARLDRRVSKDLKVIKVILENRALRAILVLLEQRANRVKEVHKAYKVKLDRKDHRAMIMS